MANWLVSMTQSLEPKSIKLNISKGEEQAAVN